MPPEVGNWVTTVASAGKEPQGPVAVGTALPWDKDGWKYFLYSIDQLNPMWYNSSMVADCRFWLGDQKLHWEKLCKKLSKISKNQGKQTNNCLYSVPLLNITGSKYFYYSFIIIFFIIITWSGLVVFNLVTSELSYVFLFDFSRVHHYDLSQCLNNTLL